MKKDKYKILFLPYKASMWDALYSIYKVAVADPRCQVTVVSVPYYQEKKGQQEGELICEQGLYPSDVHDISYKEYSLEERPDMIFIHNPYDATNKVTRVLEKYHSSELIKYTAHLVYIPYFVTKAGEMIEEHFCQLPAVFRSWRVIVQSEKVRKIYLKYQPEKKIVALGSPKFDMVKSICEGNNLQIPDKWRSKIEGKKVFLYNTHLRKILDGTVLEELQYVVDTMRNYHGAVLLWRPHPLSLVTAQSVNEQFAEEYQNFVDHIRQMEHVIYDETPEIDRAIALCDAYLGDTQSSVVQLYGITGKPIYDMENWKKDGDFCSNCIQTLGAEVSGTRIWMTSMEDNSLFCMDTESGKLNRVAKFSKEKNTVQNLYVRSVMDENCIYFIPSLADNIGVFDKRSIEISYISLPERTKNEYAPVLAENYLWLLPMFFELTMYRIDLKTKQVVPMASAYKRDLIQFRQFGKIPLFSEAKVIGNKMYQVCMVMPVISIYDSEKDTFDYREVPVETSGFVAISYDGEDFWILPKEKGTLIKWDAKADAFSWLLYPEEQQAASEQLPFSDIVCDGETLWLIPFGAKVCIKIELLKGIVKEIYCCQPEGVNAETLYDRYKIQDKKLYLFPYQADNICLIDMDSEDVTWLSTKYEEKKSFDVSEGAESVRQYVYSQKYCSLEEYVELVIMEKDEYLERRKASFCKGLANINTNAGCEIWKYLLEELEAEECRTSGC